ncbi:MAG TPA: inositol monophosphatase family protein [Candidatus Sulfomarinibacteraceae bacterium]|nr:inositol monophosphatase family protein [Candidatus Sulfomarinibacteraceae bacterium]
MSQSWRPHLEFATQTAWQAGQLTLGYFQTGLRPDFKDDDSPVTVADRNAEELIRQRIDAQYPDYGIIGEEYGEAAAAGMDRRWIIDPIDGTRSFVRGVPLYAVLIALEVDGDVPVGVAYFPALGEMIAAARGQGCWWNGRPARVSQVSNLQDSIISFTDPATFAQFDRAAPWARLQACGATCRGWSDAYGHALVATGRADVMLDPIMSVWDCAPFLPILQEAGGYFGDWDGNPTIRGREALSTNQALLPEVLALIREKHDS